MAEEFSQVNLIWSQKSVGHLYQRPSEHHGNNTWNISDDGFLAVYLEGFMAWIPAYCISLNDRSNYERLAEHPLLSNKEPTDLVMDSLSVGKEADYLVADPASYANLDVIIVYIRQIATVKLELFILDDLSEAYPLIDIAFECSKNNYVHENFVMKHGNPVAFVESIGCHVKIQRNEQTYTLLHKPKTSTMPNDGHRSVIQNLCRRVSFVSATDTNIEDSVSRLTWATLGLFSTLTQFSRDTLFNPHKDDKRPDKSSAAYLETWSTLAIPKKALPDKPSWDDEQLSHSDLSKLQVFAKDQYLDHLFPLVFAKGVSASLRPLVWPLLLQVPGWSLDTEKNADIARSLEESYKSIKHVWHDIQLSDADLKVLEQRKTRIVKDVLRTDRNIPFYQKTNNLSASEYDALSLEQRIDNANCTRLKDILISYCYYNPGLEYVQGMSDLLAPILFVVNDEALAFWLFVNYMNLMEGNFHEGGEHIKASLAKLEKLVRLLLPELYKFLSEKGVLHFFFCYRWVLIRFKREFSFEDTLSIWERLWTGYPSKNMWIFVCVAILELYQADIMALPEFEDILQFVNQLAGRMNIREVIVGAENQFYRFSYLMQFIDDDELQSLL